MLLYLTVYVALHCSVPQPLLYPALSTYTVFTQYVHSELGSRHHKTLVVVCSSPACGCGGLSPLYCAMSASISLTSTPDGISSVLSFDP